MIITAYGEWMASVYSSGGPMRFRVQARDSNSGSVCAMQTWVWDGRGRRYVPAGEPWITWGVT